MNDTERELRMFALQKAVDTETVSGIGPAASNVVNAAEQYYKWLTGGNQTGAPTSKEGGTA